MLQWLDVARRREPHMPLRHEERSARGSVGSGRVRDDDLLEPAPGTPASRHLLAVAVYLVVALAMWSHVWFGGNPAHSITCNCGDTSQQVWWLEWFPWALSHGHNPFLTNAMWARMGGVNAITNTSWMAPAALLWPVTSLFGPVASFNVANLLAPVVSGWAAFVLAGRFSRAVAPRLVAGGLYAFSPYVLRNTVLGHIDLTISAYLPLVVLLVLGLLTRGARPVRIGVWLGLLTVVQFFTGVEVMAITAVTVALGALLVVASRPRLVRAALPTLMVAGSVAATIAVVCLAYPVWFYLRGARHVQGPFWPVVSSAAGRIVEAGANVHSTHTSLRAVGYLGPQGPNTDFLGFGLLVAVVVSVPLWWRRTSCAVVAGVALLTWVLEFFPAHAWARLPVLASVELVRLALPVSLCVGLLLAASIDGWWEVAGGRWRAGGDAVRRGAARAGVVVLSAAAFVPLLVTYSVPFRVTTASVPAWFVHDAPHLAKGTAVLTIPFAYGVESQPMAWQAETGDAFDLMGGWAFVPGANGVDDEIMSPPGGPVSALRALSGDPLRLTSSAQASIRAAVLAWRPLTVVVIPGYAQPGALAAMTATLGLSPTWSDGAWVWTFGPRSHLGPVHRL